MGMMLSIGPIEGTVVLNPAARPYLEKIIKEAKGAIGENGDYSLSGDSSLGLVIVDAKGRSLTIREGCWQAILIIVFLAVIAVWGIFIKSHFWIALAITALGILIYLSFKLINPIKEPEGKSALEQFYWFTKRSSERLKKVHNYHMIMAKIVFPLLASILIWSVYLVTTGKVDYATALGTSSLGGMIVTGLIWRPFTKAKEALLLAEIVDASAVSLFAQMENISKIEDPKERAKLQAEVILNYTTRLRGSI